jgi:hypothetical protein
MRTPENQIDIMKEAHPADTTLFGPEGAFAATLCAEITKEFYGKQFNFMDVNTFDQIKDIKQLNQIYWRELLFRAYWAAALNLMRHQRWQSACVAALTPSANLLSFAASLRGLVEASSDAFYSLRPVPPTLAFNRDIIEPALKGQLNEVSIIQELEDRLIHFVYGRKISKSEKGAAQDSHIALEPKEYRNAIDLLKWNGPILRACMTNSVDSATLLVSLLPSSGVRTYKEARRRFISLRGAMERESWPFAASSRVRFD